ncbi:hypothetical protein BD770DRAFT_319080, partial [Pilaira anomala]
LLLTSSTTQTDQEDLHLHHPLHIIGCFLCSQSRSIITLYYAKEDPFRRVLYAIANRNLGDIVGEESKKLDAIGKVCDITEIQLNKIKILGEKEDDV